MTNFVPVLETCYHCYKYQRCVEIYQEYVDAGNQKCGQALLIYGKALFHVFRREMHLLSSLAVDRKTYRQHFSRCFQLAKQCIVSLGTSLDSGLLDDEGMKFLDLAMISYASRTNNLNACKRCLLCHKHSNLQRSHLWPESMLRHFKSGVSTPSDHKLFISMQEDGTMRRLSPRELSFWMFCTNCEQNLSNLGERHFIPLFTKQIYNLSDLESPLREQEFSYREWLFHFCVGIIFRGLATQEYITSFTNEDELYDLFVSCRSALCGSSLLQKIAEKFHFCVLFSPTKLGPKESASGFINTWLTSFGEFVLSDICLSNGVGCIPREAQFFLAHCGVFNIIVPLGRSREVPLPASSCIHPCSGTYKVPAADKRLALLPRGMVTFFHLMSDRADVTFFETPKHYEEYTSRIGYIQPDTKAQCVIGANPALDTDIDLTEGFVKSAFWRHNPKVLNYLPSSFKLQKRNHRQPKIILPLGHKLLMHHTFATDDGMSHTLFLGIGHGDIYTKNPYLLYHAFTALFSRRQQANLSAPQPPSQGNGRVLQGIS